MYNIASFFMAAKPAISTIIRKAMEAFDAPRDYFDASTKGNLPTNIRAFAIYAASKYGHSIQDIRDAFGYKQLDSVRGAITKVEKSIQEKIPGFEANALRLKLFIEDKLEKVDPQLLEDKQRSLSSIRHAVAACFNIHAQDLTVSEETKQHGKARAIFSIVAKQVGHQNERIMHELGYASAGQIASMLKLNESRMQQGTHGILEYVTAVREVLALGSEDFAVTKNHREPE